MAQPTPAAALPDYARPDMAFTVTESPPLPGPASGAAIVVVGDYIYNVLAVFAKLRTDATVGPRTMEFNIEDSSGNGIARITAPAAQPAGQTYSYTWTQDSGAAYYRDRKST